MKKIRLNPHEYFYLMLFVAILIQLYFIPEIRLGIVTSIIIIFLAFNGMERNIILANTTENKLILTYILYNSATSLLYITNNIPLSVFTAEWSNSILPTFFYYFAKKNNDNKNNFYKITLYVLILSFIIGFLLWTSNSELYRVFMDTTEGSGTDLLFFQSLFGLTATGAFGVIGFLISAHLIFKSNGDNGKIALLICAIAAILTLRRATLLVLFTSFFVLHYLAYFKFNFLKKKYFIVEALVLYVMYLLTREQYGDLFESIIERGGMISDAFESRNDAWKYAFESGYLITGRGLGSVGHKAIEFSSNLIPDGNYFKILAETGVIGFSLFAFIMTKTIINGSKQLNEKYLELGLVLSICLIAIGSNIFTYQSISPIFWYSVGQLSLNKKNTH